MSEARLLVLVFGIGGEPVKAAVTLRIANKDRGLEFDPRLTRYVAKGLEPGKYELLVKGPDGTAPEQRTVNLKPGDNHVWVMVAKPGLFPVETPRGRWYVDVNFGERLLHVRGPGALKIALEALKGQKIEGTPVVKAGEAPRQNDVTFKVALGKDADAARVSQGLTLLTTTLAQKRLRASVSAPVYVGKEIQGGLGDEITVRFRSATTTGQIAEIAKKFELTQTRSVQWMGNGFAFRLPGGPSDKVFKVVAELSCLPQVAHVEPNFIRRLYNMHYTPADYLYPETPHLQVIHADDAWDTIQTTTAVNRGGSPDVVIGVLDLDGVDPTHPELTGNLSDGSAKMIANYDFTTMSNQTHASLDGDHGTQCAGSATARFDNTIGTSGVAPNCKLIGAKFSGWSTDLEIADIWVWMAGFPTNSTIAGFPAQLPNGAHIISNSWGPYWASPNQTLRDAFDFLTTYPRSGRGVIMCFAAGNYGYDLVDARNPYAADEKTLCIGSSINMNPTNPCDSLQPDQNGNTTGLPAVVDTRAYFSPYGMAMDIVSPSHTCYGPGLPGAGIVDPIMSCSAVGHGNWPAQATTSTTLTGAVAVGATSLPVASTAGFAAGSVVLLDAPGAPSAETTTVSAVGAGTLTVTAITLAHAAGTSVVTGAADYAMNASVGFGGTSHSCPTVAGAAALLLSVKPDLNWVEVRQVLRTTAEHIDSAQAFATGQWQDTDGDGTIDFSQWYGYGRLDVNAAVTAAIGLVNRTDCVVRDNLADNGTVPSTGWHAESPDIWVTKHDDPIPALAYGAAPPHENPEAGHDNYVFVRVRNNGTATAPVVYLRALISHFGGIEFIYPDDWEPTPRFGDTPALPLQPGSYLIGEAEVTNLAPGADTIRKITWDQDLVPPQTVTIGGVPVTWHPCLLLEATPHDGPAIVTGLYYPVKGDNNIAHRNITIDYPVGGSSEAMSAVVAGTRDRSGVQRVIIDPSGLPAGASVLLTVLDPVVMKTWLGNVRAGKDILKAEPLGKTPPRDIRQPVTRPPITKPIIPMPIDKTKLGLVKVDTWKGQTVLRISAAAGPVSLPLKLGPKQWTPLAVAVDNITKVAAGKGRVLVSQLRGDGQVSPGYEIRI